MAIVAMALPSSTKICIMATVLAFFLVETAIADGNLWQNLEVTWGSGRGSISGDGQLLTLSLDKTSGSGFRSYATYMFGRIDVQMKLVADNSAGTVTTLYLLSEGAWDIHDEIDLEFLGNLSGNPYTLHTNVFANGKGGKEQQFHLWFDPTADFHTYSILWSPRHIVVMVDGTPIRDFKNHEAQGIPYPSRQPMRAFGSLWAAEDWATMGGRVKTVWSQAPFVASYRNYTATPFDSSAGSSWFDQEMDSAAQAAMASARKNYMVYDYCDDRKRFPQGFPPECSMP